ncbi:MAG: EAL domain-containing protein [Gammaproteobacteria bacterium]|nr:EAL domain-containing protein [Gammaproteobacteria bacterium]
MSRDKFSLSEILQVQVVFLFIFSGLGLTLTFMAVYIYLEMYLTVTVLFLSFLSGIFLLWLLRKRQKSELVAHIALIIFFIIIIMANLEFGGFDNPNDAWFMVIVVVSGLLLTRHSVWLYALVALAVSITFYLLKVKGVEFPLKLPAEKVDLLNLFNRIGTVLTTGFLIVLFRYERNTRQSNALENEQKLYQLANYDRLTELSNRSYFSENFERRIIQEETDSQSLLFIDLDSFKVVNDSFGHNIGDELLQAVAKRFKTQLSDKDLICRHGGDEFLVMPRQGYSKGDIENLCINLIRVLNQPFHINDQTLHIGCSIGVAFFPEHGASYLELLRAADIAMYRAKAQGSEQFQVFNRSLAEEVHNKNKLALDLREAIEKGELTLVYQPKVSLRSKQVIGYEALMRWTNSENKTIEPSVFIKIAEDFSLVHKLGEWLINSVCKQLNDWRLSEQPIKKIAINISAKQLLRSDFVTEIIRVTNLYQIDPSLIELELTESVFIESSHDTLSKLNKLSDLGFSLVIDDYGTGYASLGYLKRFPVTGLKIDKSFIDEILESDQDRKIVGSTIALAHELGLEIIAEGVEEDAQLELLKQLGCDLIQGYYFSKPLLVSEVFATETEVN